MLKIFFYTITNFFSYNIELITVLILFITALILLATIILALIKSKRERITLGIQTLYDLQNEYRSLAIKEAKRQFIHHYHDICNEDRERWIHYYFKLLQTNNELDKHRQTFSHFYQKLAHFYEKKIITNDLLFPAWSWRDFKILGEIILPMEERFPRPSKTALNNLRKLYKDFLDWKMKAK